MRHAIAIWLCYMMMLALIALMIGGCGGTQDAVRPTANARIIIAGAPPSALQALNVDLQELQLFSHSAPATVILDEADLPDHINLLDLADDPIVMENVRVPTENYTAVRLLINETSPQNTLRTADGEEHRWTMDKRDADGNMRVIKQFQVVPDEQIVLLIDFRAEASVHRSITGEWILRPLVFVHKLNDPTTTVPDLASLRGTVLDRSGQPLQATQGQVVGVIVEREGGDRRVVTVTEADPETGEYRVPYIQRGRYLVSVRMADQRWEVTGPPLPLDTAAGPQDVQVVNLAEGQSRVINLTADQ